MLCDEAQALAGRDARVPALEPQQRPDLGVSKQAKARYVSKRDLYAVKPVLVRRGSKAAVDAEFAV